VVTFSKHPESGNTSCVFYVAERDAINGCLLRGLIDEKVVSFADIRGSIAGRADGRNERETRAGIAI
jgi:hypothetical protein